MRSAIVGLSLASLVAGVLVLAPGDAHAQRAAALVVPGFGNAMVVEPRASGRRPVLVVLHGMGDRPESICPAFDRLAGGRAWIVCTRGIAFGDLWTYPPDQRQVGREIHAAIAALGSAYADRVDVSAPLLAGFSLGAMYASFLALRAPRSFPRALVIDTHHVWTRAELARFESAGHGDATFVCSRRYVRDCGRLDAPSVVLLPSREHGYDAVLFDALHARFEQLVASDPRWSR